MSKLKVMTFLGTRPEIIRLSRTMALLDEHVDHLIVHTGQNYDYELNEIFFKDLEIRKPDFFMGIDHSSLEASVGDIIRKSGEMLRKHNPDAVLVLGDTNSCLAAYMAKRLHIPIFHMEAGNRCFDLNVPEEINRRIIDHISDFNLVYTEHARRHLIAEGIQQRRIYLSGSPMREVLDHYLPKIKKSDAVVRLNLSKGKYFIVSVHREENVDNEDNLIKILTVLNRLAAEYGNPVIVSTHPRTRKRLTGITDLKTDPLIQFMKPFGFVDYVNLQMNSLCTISDSGTISEESAILDFPAISIRQSMERPEAQDSGTIILSGFDPDIVVNCIRTVITEFESGKKYPAIPYEYTIPDCSWRVLKLILGNTKLSNIWWGINK